MAREGEHVATLPKQPLRVSREQRDFLRRRTMQFIRGGTHYSLEHLLQEAYLQGLRDAADVLNVGGYA